MAFLGTLQVARNEEMMIAILVLGRDHVEGLIVGVICFVMHFRITFEPGNVTQGNFGSRGKLLAARLFPGRLTNHFRRSGTALFHSPAENGLVRRFKWAGYRKGSGKLRNATLAGPLN